MLASMTARQFAEWMAYLMIEKPGELRQDWRFAQLTAVVANCMGRGKGQPPFRVKEFLPDLRAEAEIHASDHAMMKAKAEVDAIRAQARRQLLPGPAG